MKEINQPPRTKIHIRQTNPELEIFFPKLRFGIIAGFFWIMDAIMFFAVIYGYRTTIQRFLADTKNLIELAHLAPYTLILLFALFILFSLNRSYTLYTRENYLVFRKRSLLISRYRAIFIPDVKSLKTSFYSSSDTKAKNYFIEFIYEKRDKSGNRIGKKGKFKFKNTFFDQISKPECEWITNIINEFFKENQRMRSAEYKDFRR
ncbi:MAG: hypothetical protein JXR63_09515 [Spirochaetales bacterium]|nr:hypothetical protein [Spirochaetales bacterium]